MLSVAVYNARRVTKGLGKPRYSLRGSSMPGGCPDTKSTAVGLRVILTGEPDSQIWEGSCPGEQEPSFFLLVGIFTKNKPGNRYIKYKLPRFTLIAVRR